MYEAASERAMERAVDEFAVARAGSRREGSLDSVLMAVAWGLLGWEDMVAGCWP